jgi:hypothetical protein
LLDKFILDLNLKELNQQPKTLSNFKYYFINWTNKQDQLGKLVEYSKYKSKEHGAL